MKLARGSIGLVLALTSVLAAVLPAADNSLSLTTGFDVARRSVESSGPLAGVAPFTEEGLMQVLDGWNKASDGFSRMFARRVVLNGGQQWSHLNWALVHPALNHTVNFPGAQWVSTRYNYTGPHNSLLVEYSIYGFESGEIVVTGDAGPQENFSFGGHILSDVSNPENGRTVGFGLASAENWVLPDLK